MLEFNKVFLCQHCQKETARMKITIDIDPCYHIDNPDFLADGMLKDIIVHCNVCGAEMTAVPIGMENIYSKLLSLGFNELIYNYSYPSPIGAYNASLKFKVDKDLIDRVFDVLFNQRKKLENEGILKSNRIHFFEADNHIRVISRLFSNINDSNSDDWDTLITKATDTLILFMNKVIPELERIMKDEQNNH